MTHAEAATLFRFGIREPVSAQYWRDRITEAAQQAHRCRCAGYRVDARAWLRAGYVARLLMRAVAE